MPQTIEEIECLQSTFLAYVLIFPSQKDITFLDNDQVQNTKIGIDDAPTDRFALALASPAGTVAGVPLAKQQAHTTVGQYTLLHGKTLLVVASADANHITLEKRKLCLL